MSTSRPGRQTEPGLAGAAEAVPARGTSIYRIGRAGDRPLPALPPGSTPMVEALRFGITAPSPHNTQPWRIELVSGTQARLFFDPGRRLPETDPPGRQGHIGHGTLIEMTAIAATSLGYRLEADILPEGEMTVPEFGTRPTAVLRLAPAPGQPVDPLFAQVLTRRSSRLPHQGPPVTDEERAGIEKQAQFSGVEVGWVPPGKLARVLDIAAQAMAIEVDDRVLFDETLRWFRFSDREIAEKGDGLHLDTSGLHGLPLWLGRRFTTPRTWHASYNRRPYLKGFTDSARSTRALLTLTTPTNTMRDWITTGRAYMRAQLAAAEFGLRFQPISQVLQEYRQMDQLRGEMNTLMGVAEPTKLQMLVRVGRTSQPGLSPRRDLSVIAQPPKACRKTATYDKNVRRAFLPQGG